MSCHSLLQLPSRRLDQHQKPKPHTNNRKSKAPRPLPPGSGEGGSEARSECVRGVPEETPITAGHQLLRDDRGSHTGGPSGQAPHGLGLGRPGFDLALGLHLPVTWAPGSSSVDKCVTEATAGRHVLKPRVTELSSDAEMSRWRPARAPPLPRAGPAVGGPAR